jgi:hypothetical protein
VWISPSTAATFGAVSAIRRLISSTPPTTYLSRHGDPVDGASEMQSSAMLVNPMSLPLIVTVTSAVSADSAFSCGGFGRGETFCGAVMSSVSAPLHVASRYSA